MIAADLIEAFDSGAPARWNSFSKRVLTTVLATASPESFPREVASRGLILWNPIAPNETDLAELRTAVWQFLESKHGNSWQITDPEDRLLRATLCGLWESGDRDAAVEAAGWVEDFLQDMVD